MRRPTSALLVVLPVVLTAVLAACADEPADTGRPLVAVAFYPLEEIVREVAGDAVDIVSVVPPGEEAHEYEPTPKQLTALGRADVVVYLGNGFQPSVEQAVSTFPDDVVHIDLLEGLPLLGIGDDLDPHVWLDPELMIAMTERVRDELSAAVPAAAADFADRATRYTDALRTLDEEMATGLAQCSSNILVTGHEAFGYLAAAYGLRQEAIAGISPAEEPSAKALERITQLVRDEGVTTVFFEAGLPADLARTIADETGVGTAELYTLESPSADELAAGADYRSQMLLNLAALRAGLGCT